MSRDMHEACPETSHCGAKGIRTPDPLHAMQVRYQLRHSPETFATKTKTLLATSQVYYKLGCWFSAINRWQSISGNECKAYACWLATEILAREITGQSL